MARKLFLPTIFLFLLVACNKRNFPSKSARIIYDAPSVAPQPVKPTPEKQEVKVVQPSAVEASKETVNRPVNEVAQTIYVNDAAAKKSVDGRLYYDVEGHRYWKNYKDGKYYLFNKTMYNNPDFKPPSGKRN